MGADGGRYFHATCLEEEQLSLDHEIPLWLLSDVGGTNVRFALSDPGGTKPLLVESVRAFRVAEFASLSEAARSYLEVVAAKPERAVFALAGRVDGEIVQLTNHAWSVSKSRLQADLGLKSLKLVNDFAAVGMGLPLLGSGDMLALGPKADVISDRTSRQTFCVLGPGTGLGVSALVIREGQIFALETEGGHVSYAPTTGDEIAILQQLMARFGRVSNERLLCGSGLANLHQAICQLARVDASPISPEEIVARAQNQGDPFCIRAVEGFCNVLGSVAGDFALCYGAWDGVYLAGGLVAPLLPWLRHDNVRQRFNDKGRFTSALKRVPLVLVTHRQPGLLGAAGIAVLEAGESLLRDGAPSRIQA
jgi:glucokinase